MNTENLTEYPSEPLEILPSDINTPVYKHTIFNEICDFIKLSFAIIFMCACILLCCLIIYWIISLAINKNIFVFPFIFLLIFIIDKESRKWFISLFKLHKKSI